MEKGNVLVIGNSGVGKSTLINAVLGEEKAKTGCGTKGTTEYLEIYESDEVPFRIIDSVGFEPSFIKKRQAVHAVKKWSRESAKKENENRPINVIWFCVDGMAKKLFSDTIKSLSSATSMWESVPVVVVITKSYGIPDREEDVRMVYNAFAQQKRYSKNLRKVIPVVASAYVLNESAYAPPEGISELIDITNELMPEGIKAAEKDIYQFKLSRKRALAQGIVSVSTTAGITVGAVPVPLADAFILSSIEVAEINALARVYGINKNEESKHFFNSIVEAGTVSAAARGAISALKGIPGVNLAAGLVNAVIAGSFVAAIGEGTIYAFEQVYLGKKTVKDIDWVTKAVESRLSTEFIDKVASAVRQITENTDKNAIGKVILDLFGEKEKQPGCNGKGRR